MSIRLKDKETGEVREYKGSAGAKEAWAELTYADSQFEGDWDGKKQFINPLTREEVQLTGSGLVTYARSGGGNVYVGDEEVDKDALARFNKQELQDRKQGIAAEEPLLAGGLGALSGATFGLSTRGIKAAMGNEEEGAVDDLFEANPLATIVGEIGGTLALTALTAGAGSAMLGARAGVAGAAAAEAATTAATAEATATFGARFALNATNVIKGANFLGIEGATLSKVGVRAGAEALGSLSFTAANAADTNQELTGDALLSGVVQDFVYGGIFMGGLNTVGMAARKGLSGGKKVAASVAEGLGEADAKSGLGKALQGNIRSLEAADELTLAGEALATAKRTGESVEDVTKRLDDTLVHDRMGNKVYADLMAPDRKALLGSPRAALTYAREIMSIAMDDMILVGKQVQGVGSETDTLLGDLPVREIVASMSDAQREAYPALVRQMHRNMFRLGTRNGKVILGNTVATPAQMVHIADQVSLERGGSLFAELMGAGANQGKKGSKKLSGAQGRADDKLLAYFRNLDDTDLAIQRGLGQAMADAKEAASKLPSTMEEFIAGELKAAAKKAGKATGSKEAGNLLKEPGFLGKAVQSYKDLSARALRNGSSRSVASAMSRPVGRGVRQTANKLLPKFASRMLGDSAGLFTYLVAMGAVRTGQAAAVSAVVSSAKATKVASKIGIPINAPVAAIKAMKSSSAGFTLGATNSKYSDTPLGPHTETTRFNLEDLEADLFSLTDNKQKAFEKIQEEYGYNPGLADSLTKAYEARLSYMHANIPKPVNNAGFGKPNYDALPSSAVSRYHRIRVAADKPEVLLEQLANNNLDKDTINAVRSMSPYYFNDVAGRLAEAVAAGNIHPSYKHSVGKLLGGIKGTLGSPSSQLTLALSANQQPQRPSGGGGKRGGGTAASTSKGSERLGNIGVT